jgi:hypothetical protein
MNKVLLAMLFVVAALASLITIQAQRQPVPTANAVIGEKPGKTMGNQVAQLLPETLNEKQARLLRWAYELGKKAGLKNPEVVQSIILQETHAGGLKSYKVANPGNAAWYGVSQLTLVATKDVLERNPDMYAKYDFHTRTDDEIKANLILNDRFNIDVASKYVKLLQTVYGYSGSGLLVAYNRGPGAAKGIEPSTDYYVVGGAQKLQSFKSRHPAKL